MPPARSFRQGRARAIAKVAGVSELFSGPQSLRWPSERRSFVLTVMFLPVSIAVVGFFLRHAFDWSEIAILIVIAMIYVAILRGRLLGTGVRVDQRQFPELLAVVRQCANSLGVVMPEVFIREDMYAPVVAIGFSPPYSLVISSYYLPHVGEDALRFLVGRELGHVAAGHTRVSLSLWHRAATIHLWAPSWAAGCAARSTPQIVRGSYAAVRSRLPYARS